MIYSILNIQSNHLLDNIIFSHDNFLYYSFDSKYVYNNIGHNPKKYFLYRHKFIRKMFPFFEKNELFTAASFLGQMIIFDKKCWIEIIPIYFKCYSALISTLYVEYLLSCRNFQEIVEFDKKNLFVVAKKYFHSNDMDIIINNKNYILIVYLLHKKILSTQNEEKLKLFLNNK